jgi:hypothetical protein
MAAGDIVNAIGATNSALSFVPAATVEVMITTASGGSGGAWINLENATTPTGTTYFTETIALSDRYGFKFFINNTNYLLIKSSGLTEQASYTGIQIK